MRDFASSRYQKSNVSQNKTKVQRPPINFRKYLKPLGWVAASLAAVCLIAAVLYGASRILGSTTWFRINSIDVTAGKRLNRDDILALADIGIGNDLLKLNLKKTGEQISRNPWVETVHIRRYFPNTLSLSVTEREPVAVVNMGLLYYLDPKGNIFKMLNQGDRLDYPVITGFSEEGLASDPNGSRDALKTTCELLNILRVKGTFILADVSEIHYDRGYGFTLFTANGALPVKIGSGDFAAKIDRFARIYRELMAQQPALRYIDLDFNDKIVVKKG